MTPEKLLDYSVKFGVLPFMLYMIWITRQDLTEVKQQLNKCYEERINELKPSRLLNSESWEYQRPEAVLPEKFKYKFENV